MCCYHFVINANVCTYVLVQNLKKYNRGFPGGFLKDVITASKKKLINRLHIAYLFYLLFTNKYF